jgi:multidrug efflux pump subunit AcrA (membrane-fusion protein)
MNCVSHADPVFLTSAVTTTIVARNPHQCSCPGTKKPLSPSESVAPQNVPNGARVQIRSDKGDGPIYAPLPEWITPGTVPGKKINEELEMKRLAWVTAAVLVTVVSVLILNGSGDRVHAQQGRPVQPTKRQSGTIPASDCAIMLIDEAILASERPGIIAWCELQEGDPVFTGTRVASLKDGVAVAAKASAEHKASNDINERYQHFAWKLAQKELEIAEEANRKLPGTVPRLEIEKLILAAQRGELAYEQAKFEREASRKLLAESEEQLKTYTVLAPFDGIVSRVHRHRGEAVTQGAPIVKIISTARVKVEGFISPSDSYTTERNNAVSVQAVVDGKRVTWTDEDGMVRDRFLGHIQFVSAEVEPLLKKVKVIAYVPNIQGRLKAGLETTMTITPARATAAGRGIPRR